MLKAIIVDNEEPATQILQMLLEKTGQITVVGNFLRAADALSSLKATKPDVAFLDIEIPDTSGLELANHILAMDSDVEIIFVTAYDHYALHAFRVNALDYLLKPLLPEDVERAVRRLIKRKGLAKDFAPESPLGANIHYFGKFTVYGPASKKPVKWRTSKAEELFAYLVQNLEKEVPKWRICEALWPEYDTEKVDIQLHTTVYKLKKVLASANIPFDLSFSNGCYWLSLPQAVIDKVEFDAHIASSVPVNQSTIARCEQALSLYTGDYLEENGYLWSLALKAEYGQKFYKLASSVVKFYMTQGDYVRAEKTLSSILERCPLDETVHEMLLTCYFTQKDRTAFITHYHTVWELFQTELGIEPGMSIQTLYHRLLKKMD
ncbi:response regulator [Desulfitobacterium chlororespirans]|uniref:Stage 0 sporulation protein A homolog n=1 Tax=Desulfitobacterium chlororespirans DSM 11544 TaxID=1121395 RepID=A0A1M7S375_9FIRM|nr:response regulator [Desulfitobacterium chlororespirans]SHN52844.1 response regulator receiver and SARP domain protein [Desulfitobacterium chlororespirans DSM 11544]